MPAPLTMKELRLMIAGGCQAPGCTHEKHPIDRLDLSAGCHQGGGVKLTIHTDGALRIRCAQCGRPVGCVQVAESGVPVDPDSIPMEG